MKFKWTHFNGFHLLDWEIQDHRLLDPLIHLPPSLCRLRYTQSSFVQAVDNRTYSVLGVRML